MSKKAIVTGASRGIGKGIAMCLAAEGYDLAISYASKKEEAEKVAEQIRETYHTRCFAYQAALQEKGAGKALFDRAVADLGGLDLLVNNAGVSEFALFTDISDSSFERMMDVNFKGAFLLSQLVLPAMVSAQSGCIINISSMWGQIGASCEVHYSASKAAMIGMTKALAKEAALSGVRVNCIAPGAIDTDMNSALSREDKAALADEIPMGRLGRAEEVAALAVFLADESAGYITGQVIGVNGGFVV